VVRLVVGLGNPGSRYRFTRHNVGFMVLEELRQRAGGIQEVETGRCAWWRTERDDGEVVLARPTTFMNRSGVAVRDILEQVGAGPEEMLVVCDDFHLDLGVLRLRRQGSHGGHNGLRSIIDVLRTSEFPRLRIGIGPVAVGDDQADFVLDRFDAVERERLPGVVGDAADCVDMVLRSGCDVTMNHFNRRQGSAAAGPDRAAE
jgi:PTH1 family peptidyl-tRNA hydrolase